jgi:hypothetical protein
VAHLVGFAVPWRLVKSEDMPYSTRILAGRVDLGHGGIRVYAVAWLLLAVGFVAAALGVATGGPWGVPLAAGLALASLGFSVLSWPASRVGVYVNAVILIWLFTGARLGAF